MGIGLGVCGEALKRAPLKGQTYIVEYWLRLCVWVIILRMPAYRMRYLFKYGGATESDVVTDGLVNMP